MTPATSTSTTPALTALPSPTVPEYFKVSASMAPGATSPTFEVTIESTKVVNHLESCGFFRAVLMGEVVFVRNLNQRLRVVQDWEVMEFLCDEVRVLDTLLNVDGHDIERERLTDKLFNSRRHLEGLLDSLRIIDVKPLRDTKLKTHFVFRNGVVEVEVVTDSKGRRTPVTLRPYLPHEYYWEADVIEHDIVLQDNKSKGEWAQFIELTQNSDQNRIKALRSALGYLINTYKRSDEALICLFTDEAMATDGAQGRTGKSLVAKSISKVRPLVTIDGKRVDSRFAYSGVTTQHRVVVVDDIAREYNADLLYSRATTVFEVESKGRDCIRLPYEESPKMLITANWSMGDTSSSFMGRFREHEFSNYFNSSNTPSKRFGRVLMSDDWSVSDWNDFYNYMVGCAVIYHSDGYLKPTLVNLHNRKLMENTHPDFVMWMDDRMKRVVPGQEYSRPQFWKELMQFSRDLAVRARNTNKDGFNQVLFSRWVREWVQTSDTWVLDKKNRSSVVIDNHRPQVFIFHKLGEPDPKPADDIAY